MVMSVRMPVVVAAAMTAGGVSPVFRLKRLVHLGHCQVHGAQHLHQHVVRLNFQVIGLEFDGYMAVAQVVGWVFRSIVTGHSGLS